MSGGRPLRRSKYEDYETKAKNQEISTHKRRGEYHRNLEHVNTTMRHGTTPQQLGNVLSKDKDIMKVSTTKRGVLSGRYEICVWQLRPGVLEDN